MNYPIHFIGRQSLEIITMLTLVVTISLCSITPVMAQSSVASSAGTTGQPSTSGVKKQGLTTEQLTAQAELIAVGKVASTHADWNADHTRIVTRVAVTVGEYLKGSHPQNTITITHLGGEVGTVGELYSETATFHKDEEVIVFAKKDRQGMYRVTGANQGKMSLTTDNMTGKKMVGPGASLDDLKAKIKAAVNAQEQK